MLVKVFVSTPVDKSVGENTYWPVNIDLRVTQKRMISFHRISVLNNKINLRQKKLTMSKFLDDLTP